MKFFSRLGMLSMLVFMMATAVSIDAQAFEPFSDQSPSTIDLDDRLTLTPVYVDVITAPIARTKEFRTAEPVDVDEFIATRNQRPHLDDVEGRLYRQHMDQENYIYNISSNNQTDISVASQPPSVKSMSYNPGEIFSYDSSFTASGADILYSLNAPTDTTLDPYLRIQ